MRAAVCPRFGERLVLEVRPDPVPGPHDVVLRVTACGVCHSDLHLVDGEWASWGTPVPIVPGHEVAGIVEAVGTAVTAVKVGDRIGVPWMQYACGTCAACLAGDESLCPRQVATGVHVDGGYAERMKAPAAFVVEIPEPLDLVEAAPLLCAGITMFAPLRRAGELRGRRVAVVGIGGLGHMGLMFARALGAEVVAVTRGPDKAPLAIQCGAHQVVDAGGGRIQDALQRLGGMDLILVPSISSAALEDAVLGLAPGGTVVILAGVGEPIRVDPTFVLSGHRRIIGSTVGTRAEVRDMLRFAAARGIVPLIERYPLEQVNTVFDRLRAGRVRCRAVLLPGGVGTESARAAA